MIKIIDRRGLEKTKYLKRKYKLKESVKSAICLGCIAAIILAVLFIQADRVEKIENTNDTEAKAIQVQFTR